VAGFVTEMHAEEPAARTRAAALMERLHDEITGLFTRLDGGGAFQEDRWDRPGGGGGVARVLTEGTTLEKAGVNRSAVSGPLPAAAAQRLGARVTAGEDVRFYATGVSVVVHPRSPMVPTVHLNVRYFDLTEADGRVLDTWLGGGTDLTPTYPFP
jgi:coproporphyrinogen III oxidase